MSEIVNKLKEQKVNTLLLEQGIAKEEAPISKDIKTYKQKLEDFGINNATHSKIKERIAIIDQNNREVKKQVAKVLSLQALTGAFFPYAVIEYKTLHQVCQDYNLFISSLSFYNKAIEETNIDELQTFKDKLADSVDSFKGILFPRSRQFSFEEDRATQLTHVDFSNTFNIAAPKSHFDFRGEPTLQIGREIKPFELGPKLNYKFKVNMPEPKDPIIFMPFFLLEKLYCVIVTAWDKEADDKRILSKL